MAATAAQQFAKEYAQWERDLDAALRRASRDASKRLRNVSSPIRAMQLRMSRQAMRLVMADLSSQVYDMLRTGRIDMALLAGKVAAEADVSLLRAGGMSESDIATYLRGEEYRAVSGVEAALRRITGETHIPLSHQVYKTHALASGRVDAVVNTMLAQGSSAAEIAKAVRALINPDTPGGVSYAAKRLGRTELNNAFHASAVARYQSKPWVEAVRWNLSGSHGVPDICNEYATNDNDGIGAGLWNTGTVPAKPHPQCLCYVTPELPSRADFVSAYKSGAYDDYIDQTMSDAGFSAEYIAASKAS